MTHGAWFTGLASISPNLGSICLARMYKNEQAAEQGCKLARMLSSTLKLIHKHSGSAARNTTWLRPKLGDKFRSKLMNGLAVCLHSWRITSFPSIADVRIVYTAKMPRFVLASWQENLLRQQLGGYSLPLSYTKSAVLAPTHFRSPSFFPTFGLNRCVILFCSLCFSRDKNLHCTLPTQVHEMKDPPPVWKPGPTSSFNAVTTFDSIDAVVVLLFVHWPSMLRQRVVGTGRYRCKADSARRCMAAAVEVANSLDSPDALTPVCFPPDSRTLDRGDFASRSRSAFYHDGPIGARLARPLTKNAYMVMHLHAPALKRLRTAIAHLFGRNGRCCRN